MMPIDAASLGVNPWIEEQTQALAGRELPERVLARNFVLASARHERGTTAVEVREAMGVHRCASGTVSVQWRRSSVR